MLLVERSRVDDFPVLGQGVCRIPIGNRILAPVRVGDIGIPTDGVSTRYRVSQGRKAHSTLWAEDDTGEPFRFLAVEVIVELVNFSGIKALRGHPQASIRMMLFQGGRLLFKEVQQDRWGSVAGVSAWNKNGVKAWHARENLGPILKFIPNKANHAHAHCDLSMCMAFW